MQSALQMTQTAEARLGSTSSITALSLTSMLVQDLHLTAIHKDISDLRAMQEQLKKEQRPVCGYCQKMGHVQADCKLYKNEKGQQSQGQAVSRVAHNRRHSPCLNQGGLMEVVSTAVRKDICLEIARTQSRVSKRVRVKQTQVPKCWKNC